MVCPVARNLAAQNQIKTMTINTPLWQESMREAARRAEQRELKTTIALLIVLIISSALSIACIFNQ